jgi:hypothetical protein
VWLRAIGGQGLAAVAGDPPPCSSIRSPNFTSANFGVDRGCAGVVAGRQRHRHRVLGPAQTGALRRCGEGEAVGPRRPLAIPRRRLLPRNRTARTLSPGTRRDRCREGANREGHGLGGGIDPITALPEGELVQEFKVVVVWLLAELDVKLGLEGGEGYRCGEPGARQLEHRATSRRAATSGRPIRAQGKTQRFEN